MWRLEGEVVRVPSCLLEFDLQPCRSSPISSDESVLAVRMGRRKGNLNLSSMKTPFIFFLLFASPNSNINHIDKLYSTTFYSESTMVSSVTPVSHLAPSQHVVKS